MPLSPRLVERRLRGLLMASVVLVGLVLGPPARGAAGEPVHLLVLIDDRRERDLVQPWVTLVWPDGRSVTAMATDDGSDQEDAFAGDALWMGRVDLPDTGANRLIVRDASPGDLGPIVEERPIVLGPGKNYARVSTVRKPLRAHGDEPSKAVPDARKPVSPDGEGHGAPASGSLATREALLEAIPVQVQPWPRRFTLGIVWVSAALVLAAWQLRRTARHIEARIVGLESFLTRGAARRR